MLQPTFLITTEKEEGNYARLALEPLEKGYGHTLGVSLRRVMLSSIEGAAPTKIVIEDIQHQFSTLEGMKEDITELLLNIKSLNFSMSGEEDEAIIKLDISGPAKITGADLQIPTNLELANKDQCLAELTGKKSRLAFELTISKGLGYALASDRPSSTVGEIPLDSAYSPVIKVAYKIEATRVGRRTDYDKLIMDVWTNNTMKPQVALEKAANILVDHFKQVYDPVVAEVPKEETLEDRIEKEVLKLTVEELDLPTRIANALRKGGYATVEDLTKASKEEIAKVKNLGAKSVEAVAAALSQKELSFKE